jgi:hypothetical protein
MSNNAFTSITPNTQKFIPRRPLSNNQSFVPKPPNGSSSSPRRPKPLIKARKIINPSTTVIINTVPFQKQKKSFLPSIFKKNTSPPIPKSLLKSTIQINNSTRLNIPDIQVKGNIPEKLVQFKKLYKSNTKLYNSNSNSNVKKHILEKKIDKSIINILNNENPLNLFLVIKKILSLLRQTNTQNNTKNNNAKNNNAKNNNAKNNNAKNNVKNNAKNNNVKTNTQIKMEKINQICNKYKNIILGTHPATFFDLFIDLDDIYENLSHDEMDIINNASVFARKLHKINNREKFIEENLPKFNNYNNVASILAKYVNILRFLQGRKINSDKDIEFISNYVRKLGF